MAAWFHDVAKPSTVGGDGTHQKIGADFARDYLLKEGVDPDVVERVCDAIEKHIGYKLAESISPLEVQIVWESDKLSKLGITGMMFNLINGLRYEPNPNMNDVLERIQESLPLLREIAASMYTEPGRGIAADRMRSYEAFINLLERELNMEHVL